MEKSPQLAIEILDAIQKDQFVEWWNGHLPESYEPFPWEEREILPLNIHKSLGILEIKGFSEAGKSTGVEYLKFNPIRGYRQIVRPELIVTDAEGIDNDFGVHELKGFMRILQGNAQRTLFWNLIKNISFGQGLKQITELLKQDALNEKSGAPIKLIIERGPHDVLTTSYLAAKLSEGKSRTHRVHEGPSIIGEQEYIRPDFEGNFLTSYSLGFSFGQMVDAVVLYYVSRESQIERRLKQNKKTQGDFINEQTWPDIFAGEEFWLNCIYPIYRERYGMGLLVLNGENPAEENNLKLRNFCEKVFEITN